MDVVTVVYFCALTYTVTVKRYLYLSEVGEVS